MNLDLFADSGATADAPQRLQAPVTLTGTPMAQPGDGVSALARRLYDECQTPKPAWADLGDTTRGVWLQRAERTLAGDPEPWSIMPSRR